MKVPFVSSSHALEIKLANLRAETELCPYSHAVVLPLGEKINSDSLESPQPS